MSKNPRLNIVLRQAISSDPISGRPAIAGVYVLFENHEANVDKQEIVDMLLKHSGYERDFFKVSEDNIDMLVKKQQTNPSEPGHSTTDLSLGRIGEVTGNKQQVKLTPELKQAMAEIASKMAKDMFGQYVAEFNKSNSPAPYPPMGIAEGSGSEEKVEPKTKKTKSN